jgi:hypothetical protein
MASPRRFLCYVSASVALDAFGGSPQRVGLESVIRAKLIADELRQHSRERDFMSAVLSRLKALALANDKDFRSVGQADETTRRPAASLLTRGAVHGLADAGKRIGEAEPG